MRGSSITLLYKLHSRHTCFPGHQPTAWRKMASDEAPAEVRDMQVPRRPLRYFSLWMPAFLLLPTLYAGSNLAVPDYACAEEQIGNSALPAPEPEKKNVITGGPERKNGLPSGMMSEGTAAIILSLTTDRQAACRYSTLPGKQYAAMTGRMASINGLQHTTSVSGLTNGARYSYYVKCQDRAFNTNADDYIISFSIDNFPDTKIEQSPFKLTGKTTATFIFSSTKTATFNCSIDSEPYTLCTPPATYKNLSFGPHIFRVKSIDAFGQEDPTPAIYAWNIRQTYNRKAIQLLFEDAYLDML